MKLGRFFVSMVLVGSAALAQSQSGSVKIAEAIRPTADSELDKFATCVEKLAKVTGLKPTEAVSACQRAAETAAKLSTRVANEAADATKHPSVVVAPAYGYNGGGYGYSGGYYNGPTAGQVSRGYWGVIR